VFVITTRPQDAKLLGYDHHYYYYFWVKSGIIIRANLESLFRCRFSHRR
jgi:hypothetical protein